MTELVTPPWNLGVEGHAAGFEVDWRTGMFPLRPRQDSNGHDGEWLEIAFMPWCAVPWYDFRRADEDPDRAGLVVPAFLTVGEALFAERQRRAERLFVERVEAAQKEWGEFWREVLGGRGDESAG